MDEDAVIISPEPPAPPEEVPPPAEPVAEIPVEDTPETAVDDTADAAETLEDVLEGGGAAGGDTYITYEYHLWDEHPAMTTSFADYSVAEGLLLLIFLFSFLRFMLDLTRRWF